MADPLPPTSDHPTSELTLVLGGTGKTGRRVAQRLESLDRRVRIGSRSADPPFDWNDAATWDDALRDVTAAYVTYYPDLAFPGAVETVGAFAEAAVKAEVRRLVLLSGRGEPEAQRAEEVVAASGADVTVVRASWFAQNFSEHFLLQPVLDGTIALPGDVAEPIIDADDVADVAVAALTQDGHAGRVYEVTGPRLLTFGEMAAELTAATGREVRFVEVTPEEYAAGAAAAGVPAEEIEGLTELFTSILDGHNAYVADGVEQALGRPPRDFSDYVRRTANTGVWDRDVAAQA
jgi:uncharacterized protein YbjT (DUF2867 family)